MPSLRGRPGYKQPEEGGLAFTWRRLLGSGSLAWGPWPSGRPARPGHLVQRRRALWVHLQGRCAQPCMAWRAPDCGRG